MNRYYREFVRYYMMARRQQAECNLGAIPHAQSSVEDDLMRQVHLYDVVERRYAGFSQVLWDCMAHPDAHPYRVKMDLWSQERRACTSAWERVRADLDLHDWLYVFILHRVTGSGIHYGKSPSGYHNSLLAKHAGDMRELVRVVRDGPDGMYTSQGYQFCRFPKPTAGYRRGGDYYLCEFAPELAVDLALFVQARRRSLRDVTSFMRTWNVQHGLARFEFQYAAVAADVADFFPQHVDDHSLFEYGPNAVRCMAWMRDEGESMDELTLRLVRDTGGRPYDLEDVACDYVRWIENYVRPGHAYDHVDRDAVWNSSVIKDHPHGRQKWMLDKGLVKSFNDLAFHPTGDWVARQ